MPLNILRRSIPALLVALFITACGGGSGGGTTTPTPATTSISGTAAVGFAVANATVNIKCASSISIASSTTNASGAIQMSLSGQTLPCAIQVSGGTINGSANTTNYHSIATSAGNVNATPLTDLLIANLAGTATPSAWFASLTTTQLAAITAGQVTTATTNVKTALGLTTQLAGIDPITTVFTPTNDNVMDNTLEALQAAITTNTSYASLLTGAGASANAGFTTPVGFNAALTSAYVPPAGGGSTPAITSFTPTTGAVSTSMTITGTNLSAVTEVLFTGPSPSTAFVSGVIGTKTATSITTTVPASLTAGSYTVSIVHSGGEVAATGAFTVTTVGGGNTPAVPSGLTATAISSSQIDLSWTAAANATGYNIYRANAAYVATSLANKITAAPITGTTYNDTGLTAGTTYYYRVATVNSTSASQSMPTPDASATTMAGPTPATPVGTQIGGSRQGVAANLTVTTAAPPYSAYSYYSGATTFAGSGTIASTDGSGLLASFSSPNYITTDGISLYVAEPASIRKIDIASGAVVTFATVNTPANGITTDGTNVYVASAGWGIQQINIATGVVSTIPLIQYSPTNPTGVNLNCGYYGMTVVGANLYCISGTNSGTGIQVVDISNTATRGTVSNLAITDITAMIGGQLNGSTITFRGLVDLTTDGTNLYVTRAGDAFSNPAIDKIVISTGVVSTIAGGGTAGVVDNIVGTSASFTRPFGITTDGTSLFVVDRVTGGGIRKINIQSTAVTGANVSFGDWTMIGGPNLPTFINPRGITTDGKNVYAVDSNFGSSGTPKIIKLQ